MVFSGRIEEKSTSGYALNCNTTVMENNKKCGYCSRPIEGGSKASHCCNVACGDSTMRSFVICFAVRNTLASQVCSRRSTRVFALRTAQKRLEFPVGLNDKKLQNYTGVSQPSAFLFAFISSTIFSPSFTGSVSTFIEEPSVSRVPNLRNSITFFEP